MDGIQSALTVKHPAAPITYELAPLSRRPTPRTSRKMTRMARRKKHGNTQYRRAYNAFIVKHQFPEALIVRGMHVYSPTGVYHPHPRSSSAFMLAHMPEIRGAKVLDIGTGTGVIGLALAASELGNDVMMSDVDPAAVATAEINAMINDRWARVIRADVWEGVPRGKFDVVVWNLPFLDRQIQGPHDIIACDPGGRLAGRFLAELPARLTRGGRSYIMATNFPGSITKLAKNAGLTARELACDKRESGMLVSLVELSRHEKRSAM